MSWQAYVDDQLMAKGHCEGACILSSADGTVFAKSGTTNETMFCPRAYPTMTAQDDGSEKQVHINEQADFAKIAKGTKPATGIRINGQKYFSVGGPPDKSKGYTLWKAKGTGAGLAIAVTKQSIIVARSSQAKEQLQATMTDHVEAVADYLWKAGY